MSNEAMSKIMNSYTNSASTAARLYGCPQALLWAPKGGPEAQALTPRGLLQGVSGLHKGVRVCGCPNRPDKNLRRKKKSNLHFQDQGAMGRAAVAPHAQPFAPKGGRIKVRVCVWCWACGLLKRPKGPRCDVLMAETLQGGKNAFFS